MELKESGVLCREGACKRKVLMSGEKLSGLVVPGSGYLVMSAVNVDMEQYRMNCGDENVEEWLV